MASAPPATRADERANMWPWWLLALGITASLWWFASDALQWLVKYPKTWVMPLKFWISEGMKWLIEDFDLGLFTFKEMTRSFSWLLDWPLAFSTSLLSSGFTFSQDPSAPVLLQEVPWISMIVILVAIAWQIKDSKLAMFLLACLCYLVIFGRWDSAMVTLSSIAIAVPLGVLLGLALGIACYRNPRLQKWLTPVLDLMQTVPVFAYLVPVLFLFGFGPVAALIATVIYALPPMVRVTLLSLKQVPPELTECGYMVGCSARQLLWRVQVPAASRGVMVGVNQVIMLSLNMVIIASMIGAGGLGHDVLTSLRRLDIGSGLEAGVAITLLAITLDRLSQAFANRAPRVHSDVAVPWWMRNRILVGGFALAIATWCLAGWVPGLQRYPDSLTVTTAPLWDALVKWTNINFFDQLEFAKNAILLNVMIPFKRFLLALPWAGVILLLGVAGWHIGGWRLSLLVAALAMFVALVGLWQKAMITVYLCGVSVLIATLIGLPLGIWASANDRVHKVVQVIIDTLQTLPSFVYLIPVVMLFRVGDFAAMLAVVAYSIPPAVRYADHGLRQVPTHLVEAAQAMGCNRRQLLWRVKLPNALPDIMLGINQTIMMALSMLVITALVGTRDLGQEVYIALTKADTGRGVVAGLAVAFIAIIADRMINAWAAQRKQRLGIAY